MQPQLSYIIPIYNGAAYLNRCIDSLYNQGLSEDDFEVICIDDCSPDESVHILQEYAAQHSNIHLILHPKNLRTSTSCNEGLHVASGEYVWIVGQDDWIEENKASQLLTIAKKCRLDVLPFNYYRVNSTGGKLSAVEVFKNSEIYTGKEFVYHYFYNTLGTYLLGYEWRAIYRRRFLIDKKIVFPENVLFEDTTFMFKAIWRAQRIQSISEYIYNYRLNDKSVTDFAQRYKGYITYEYAFKTSAELLALAFEIDDVHIASQLRRTALKSMKSFAYKVIPMSISEKNIFYLNVAQTWSEIYPQIKLLPPLYQLLIRPKLGLILATILKPLFMLKHILTARTRSLQIYC